MYCVMINDVVVITCGCRTRRMRRKEALVFFLEGMMWSEGSERDRYADIYCQLVEGRSVVSDEL